MGVKYEVKKRTHYANWECRTFAMDGTILFSFHELKPHVSFQIENNFLEQLKVSDNFCLQGLNCRSVYFLELFY